MSAFRVELPPEFLAELKAEITRDVLAELDGAAREGRCLTGAKAAADYLGCSPRRVYARLHEIPHVRDGGRLMFNTRELDECLRGLG